MKKSLRELLRVFVSAGLAAVVTQVGSNPERMELFVILIPGLRFLSKYLHEKHPGKLWDWLPF